MHLLLTETLIAVHKPVRMDLLDNVELELVYPAGLVEGTAQWQLSMGHMNQALCVTRWDECPTSALTQPDLGIFSAQLKKPTGCSVPLDSVSVNVVVGGWPERIQSSELGC